MKGYLIVAIIAVVVLAIVILRPKSSKKSSGGSTGSPGPQACVKNGKGCTSLGDCCDGVCSSGVCRANLYPSFNIGNIESQGKVLTNNQHGVLVLGAADANDFAIWDGTNRLGFSATQTDANGKIVSVQVQYITGVYNGRAAQLGDIDSASSVLVNQDGTISTSDYDLYLTLDDTNTLVWQSFTTATPTIFTFNVCPDTQSCSVDGDCCGPFKKCGSDGKCQKCFGDINEISKTCCDNPPCTTIGNDYAISCNNYVMTCENRCAGKVNNCTGSSYGICSYDGTQWDYQCISKCTGDAPPNCLDYDCRQSDPVNHPDQYKYHCTEATCTPTPATPTCGTQVCDASGLNCYYTQNGQTVVPQFDCGWQEWNCPQTCDHTQCVNLSCPAGQFPKCDDTTSYQCSCSSTAEPDICGTMPRPPADKYPDAQCRYVDESKCGGPGPGWRWYEESTITNQCTLAAYHAAEGWKQYPCAGPSGNVEVMLIGDTPVSPTVNADKCRGSAATMVAPNPNITNPSGHVSGLDTSACTFTPYDPTSHDYYASPAVDNSPYCLMNTSQICQNGGSYVPASNPFLHDISSAGDSPTPAEVMSAEAGTCTCPAKTAGLNCEFNASTCGGNGYPQADDGDKSKYTCVCNPGYTGGHCEVPPNCCNGNGAASFDPISSSYKCQCNEFYTGEHCDVQKTVAQFADGYYTIKNSLGNYLSVQQGTILEGCAKSGGYGMSFSCGSYPYLVFSSTPTVWQYQNGSLSTVIDGGNDSSGVDCQYTVSVDNPPYNYGLSQSVNTGMGYMAKTLSLNVPMIALLNVGAGTTNVIRLQYIGDPTQGQIVINNASPYAVSAATECPFTVTQNGDMFNNMTQGFTAVSVPLTDPTSVGWTIQSVSTPSFSPRACSPWYQQSKPAYTTTTFVCGDYSSAVLGEVQGCMMEAMLKGATFPDDCMCIMGGQSCPVDCKPTVLQYCSSIYNDPNNKAIIDTAWGWT
jgi:hypothetical protein